MAKHQLISLPRSSRYETMNLPLGLNHNLCLCVTQASLDSILNSPDPLHSSRRERLEIPFALAISRGIDQPPREEEEVEEDDERFCGYFNVAVETLLEGLFPIVATDMMDPERIGGRVGKEDVWCGVGRDGVHKAGVGYVYRGRGVG